MGGEVRSGGKAASGCDAFAQDFMYVGHVFVSVLSFSMPLFVKRWFPFRNFLLRGFRYQLFLERILVR